MTNEERPFIIETSCQIWAPFSNKRQNQVSLNRWCCCTNSFCFQLELVLYKSWQHWGILFSIHNSTCHPLLFLSQSSVQDNNCSLIFFIFLQSQNRTQTPLFTSNLFFKHIRECLLIWTKPSCENVDSTSWHFWETDKDSSQIAKKVVTLLLIWDNQPRKLWCIVLWRCFIFFPSLSLFLNTVKFENKM